MKKLVSLLLVLMLALGVIPAMAESLLPYEGDALTYEGYTADLGITENRESPVYQEYKKLLGNVSIEWSTGPWADFDTKTAMFLNTGDLPDIVWLRNSTSVISNYGDMGYFLNFMDYLDYMPNLKSYIDTYPQIRNMTNDKGALYCLNDIEPTDYVDESFWVNKTELAKLGRDIPTTWDEMLDCMRAYKQANPNGMPFITYGWGASYYYYCLGSINNAKTGFYYDGSKWTHALLNEDSNLRDLVDMMHTMYSEGLLHPEFSTMSDEQAQQYILDGNWLFSFWYLNTIYNEIFLGEDVPYEYESMYAPARNEGDPHYSVLTVPYDNIPGWGFFVNADVKNPELICAYLDTVISQEASTLYNWGVKDLTYTVDENGRHQYTADYQTSDARKAAGVGNFMDVRYIQYKQRETDYVGGSDSSRAAYDKIIGGLISGDLIGIRALRGTPNFTAEQNEIVARSTTPFKTYIDENIMTFIDGTRDMSEWDAFVDETLALGNMDEVLATYEEAEQVIYSTERRYVSYN